MRILITGGFGNIGKNLALHLFENNFKITLSSVKKKKFKDFQSIILKPNFSKKKINAIFKNFDVILHLAGLDKDTSDINPNFAIYYNVLFTDKLAKCAIHSKIKKFIFFSTAQIYSNKLEGKFLEDSETTNSTPYAQSNLISEFLINYNSNFISNNNTIFLNLRLSNVISCPHTHKNFNWNLVANDFCKQAIYTGEIKVQNHNVQRDFISVNYLSQIIKYLINQYNISNTINISSGSSITINKLSKIIKKICKQNYNINPNIILLNKRNKPDKKLYIRSKFLNIKKLKFSNDIEIEINKILNFLILHKINLPK